MVTENIILEKPDRFTSVPEISRTKLIRAVEKATDKLEAFARKNPCAFPGTCSVDFKYVADENKNWEAGMYTGCYWLAYELTGNEFFRKEAESHIPSYRTRLEGRIGIQGHDVGFPFMPSCVAAWKITGNEEARQIALDTADYVLAERYFGDGPYKCIQTTMNHTMMDTLMNATLLLWAGKETGDERFTEAGLNQSITTNELLIRADGSSYHHCIFDKETLLPIQKVTWQGNRHESCWSRGHAWGVYGLPVAYDYTGADFLPKLHRDITYFMLNHLPSDCIPYWDYDFISGDESRDSSAGLISACGMMEMAKHLPESAEQKNVFLSAAAQIVEATIDTCTGDIGRDYDGLVNRVTHAKPQKQGIDECAVYGDYFYLEALARYLKPDWVRYW